MRFLLDSVQGHELEIGIYAGRISRMGLLLDISLPSGTVASPSALIAAASQYGLPILGSTFPYTGYERYYLKRYRVRSFTARTAGIEMVYEYLGLMVVKDTSTLQSIPSQTSPSDRKPYYVGLGAGAARVKKLLTLSSPLPLRHLIVSKTVDYEASSDVMDAFGSVNDETWQGLPIGYWLFSGIEGETLDDGITFTYTATFSTQQVWDWSQFGFLQSDNGVPITLDETAVAAVLNSDYIYGQDTSLDGLLKVGNYPLVSFATIFGI